MSGEPTLSQHHDNDPDWTAYLQGLLEQQGYDAGPIDGIFGSRTATAVRQYQFDRGLAADGVVGERTWASLGGGAGGSTNASSATGGVGLEGSTDAGDGGADVLGQRNPSGVDTGNWDIPYANCRIKRFRHAIDYEIENTGSYTWQPGEVAVVITVNRDEEGVLVQQENKEVAGVVPGEVHPDYVLFLGYDRPGRYTATVTVYDLKNHRQLDSDLYLNTFPTDD